MAFGTSFSGYSPRGGDMMMRPNAVRPMPLPMSGTSLPAGAQAPGVHNLGLALGRNNLAPGQLKPAGESARAFAPGQDRAAAIGAAQNMPGQRPAQGPPAGIAVGEPNPYADAILRRGGYGQNFNPGVPMNDGSGGMGGPAGLDPAVMEQIRRGLMMRRASGRPPLSFYDLVMPFMQGGQANG